MNLDGLAGNSQLKRQLTLQMAQHGLSHAFILSGAAGTGKRTLAQLLAAALVCTAAADARPCLHCPACQKILAGIHPDFIRVTGEDGKAVTVAQIRALRSDAYIRPNEAARKVYLIENAGDMNDSAQNALLKLLEEGPAYAAFLLLAENDATLLPTVRSRCERLMLAPVSDAEAQDYLRARFPAAPQDALAHAMTRSQGVLGRAVALLSGTETDGEACAMACALLPKIAARDAFALLEAVIPLEKWERDKLCALFDDLILLLRDALVLGAGGAADPDPVRADAARQAAQALPPKAMLELVACFEQLRAACGFYVGAGHLCGWLAAAASDMS